MKRALILGVTGQDGSYLAEILLERGVEVHGMYRRTSTGNLQRIQHLLGDQPKIVLHQGDMADPLSVDRIIREVHPQEIYNEADQDHVGWSYSIVGYSMDITTAAVGRTLETVRRFDKSIRFFQPCTAMMFGNAPTAPQNEETPFNPQSPYACAKVAAYHLSRYYRQAHDMFVSTAILYNHDSPRRSEEYLLHKICKSAIRIARGEQKELWLGDLSMRVDIGYAREYMEAAYDILQISEPDDFVIGTGNAMSIEEMVNCAFAALDISPIGRIKFDPRFARPGKQTTLVADPTYARVKFGFNPQYGTRRLIHMLIHGEGR